MNPGACILDAFGHYIMSGKITVIKFVVTTEVLGSFMRTKVLTTNQFDCGRLRVHNISYTPALGTQGRAVVPTSYNREYAVTCWRSSNLDLSRWRKSGSNRS